MIIETLFNIGDLIYWYYPKDNSIGQKHISSIIICANENDNEITLMDDDGDIICTKENITKLIPDEYDMFYFLNEEDMNKFIYGSINSNN